MQLAKLIQSIIYLISIMEKSSKSRKSNITPVKYTLISDSGCSRSVCGQGMTILTHHDEWVTSGMAIEGTGSVKMQICDAFCKTSVDNQNYILIIRNRLDATNIKGQTESLLHPSQARDNGTIVDDCAKIHGGN